jgi:hypothetical protein
MWRRERREWSADRARWVLLSWAWILTLNFGSDIQYARMGRRIS